MPQTTHFEIPDAPEGTYRMTPQGSVDFVDHTGRTIRNTQNGVAGALIPNDALRIAGPQSATSSRGPLMDDLIRMRGQRGAAAKAMRLSRQLRTEVEKKTRFEIFLEKARIFFRGY